MGATSEEGVTKADKRARATVRSQLSEAGKCVLEQCGEPPLPPGLTFADTHEASDGRKAEK